MENNALFSKINCPLCNHNLYSIIYPSKYDKKLTEEELTKIYCSSSDNKLLDQLVQCNKCNMIYINPQIKEEIIINSYENAVDPTFITQNPFRIKTFKKTLLKICKKLKITPTNNYQILDIGCAGGAFPKAASELGFAVTGIEPSKWLCDYTKNTYSLDIREGTLAKQNFQKQSFDMISMWDVLEHIADPNQTLNQINKLLKPGGKLILTFPNYHSFASKLLGSKWLFLLSVHLLYYTPATIQKQLNQTKFKLISIKPYWQTLELGYVLSRAAGYFKIFKVFELITKITGLSKLPLKYNMGQSLVIAEKK